MRNELNELIRLLVSAQKREDDLNSLNVLLRNESTRLKLKYSAWKYEKETIPSFTKKKQAASGEELIRIKELEKENAELKNKVMQLRSNMYAQKEKWATYKYTSDQLPNEVFYSVKELAARLKKTISVVQEMSSGKTENKLGIKRTLIEKK